MEPTTGVLSPVTAANFAGAFAPFAALRETISRKERNGAKAQYDVRYCFYL
jgi:hypothetical protein